MQVVRRGTIVLGMSSVSNNNTGETGESGETQTPIEVSLSKNHPTVIPTQNDEWHEEIRMDEDGGPIHSSDSVHLTFSDVSYTINIPISEEHPDGKLQLLSNVNGKVSFLN